MDLFYFHGYTRSLLRDESYSRCVVWVSGTRKNFDSRDGIDSLIFFKSIHDFVNNRIEIKPIVFLRARS